MATIDFWKQEEGRCDFEDDIDEDSNVWSPNLKLAMSTPSWVRHSSKMSSEGQEKILLKGSTCRVNDSIFPSMQKTKSVWSRSFSSSPILGKNFCFTYFVCLITKTSLSGLEEISY